MARIFNPFYRQPPPVKTRAGDGVTLQYQELPVKGWTQPFVQEDEARWVLAIDYPIDADAVTAASRRGRAPLPSLCAMLEREPRCLLHELSPPSICHSSPIRNCG